MAAVGQRVNGAPAQQASAAINAAAGIVKIHA
jgi:hypothetical protein